MPIAEFLMTALSPTGQTVEGVTHGVCHAHSLRVLQALTEHEKESWASDMQTILRDAVKLTHAELCRDKGAVSPTAIRGIECGKASI